MQVHRNHTFPASSPEPCEAAGTWLGQLEEFPSVPVFQVMACAAAAVGPLPHTAQLACLLQAIQWTAAGCAANYGRIGGYHLPYLVMCMLESGSRNPEQAFVGLCRVCAARDGKVCGAAPQVPITKSMALQMLPLMLPRCSALPPWQDPGQVSQG